MKNLNEHINFLYPDNASEVMSAIHKLVDKYTNIIDKQKFKLTENDIILITYADSFNKKDEKPLQTLRKICEDYLQDGINSIHILPFYPYSSDDGFSVIDYKKVDENLGRWKDVEELSQSFYLMFDAVINHISKSSEWFQSFLKADDEYNSFFIEHNSNDDNLKKVVRPRTLPLLHNFVKNEKTVEIWTTFSEDQIDLNYKNSQVYLKVLDVLLFYISKGARFIRFDAIAYLWKNIGTRCIHLEETHSIIQSYRSVLEHVAPQVVIVTETNVEHKDNISYFGNGYNEARMVYNFTLPPLLAYSIHKQDVGILCKWAKSLELPSEETAFFNFTASHDGVGVQPLKGIVVDTEIDKLATIAEKNGGFVSYKSNNDGSKSPYELNCNYLDLLSSPEAPENFRINRFLLTQSVVLSMPGVPGVYYHSIFGSTNDTEAVKKTGVYRRINRQKLNISNLEKELNDNNSLRTKIYSRYIEMLKVRRSEKAFNPSAQAKFYNDKGIFIIERLINNEKIICLHNFTDTNKNISCYFTNTNKWLVGKPNDKLLPYSYVWIKIEF